MPHGELHLKSSLQVIHGHHHQLLKIVCSKNKCYLTRQKPVDLRRAGLQLAGAPGGLSCVLVLYGRTIDISNRSAWLSAVASNTDAVLHKLSFWSRQTIRLLQVANDQQVSCFLKLTPALCLKNDDTAGHQRLATKHVLMLLMYTVCISPQSAGTKCLAVFMEYSYQEKTKLSTTCTRSLIQRGHG